MTQQLVHRRTSCESSSESASVRERNNTTAGQEPMSKLGVFKTRSPFKDCSILVYTLGSPYLWRPPSNLRSSLWSGGQRV